MALRAREKTMIQGQGSSVGLEQSGDAKTGDKSSLVTALLNRTHTARHFCQLTVAV